MNHIVQGEPDYSYLIGMVPKDGPPIAMERCPCGIVSLSAPCHGCAEASEKSASRMLAAPTKRQDGHALLLLCLLVVSGMGWVTWSIDRAPRPVDHSERVGNLS
jgi:hypothetical protein